MVPHVGQSSSIGTAMLAVQMAESSGVVYVYAVARQRHWTCCLAPLSALGRACTA